MKLGWSFCVRLENYGIGLCIMVAHLGDDFVVLGLRYLVRLCLVRGPCRDNAEEYARI